MWRLLPMMKIKINKRPLTSVRSHVELEGLGLSVAGSTQLAQEGLLSPVAL